MKVVSDLADADLASGPCVLSIGNFDGLHLGHRAILKTVVEKARQQQVRPAVLTFDPHPVRVLSPQRAPILISTLPQKLRLLEGLGIELVYIARFDTEFAALTPDTFIRQYLIDGFHAKAICVGSNFMFGARHAGTLETLEQWRKAFDLVVVPPVSVRGALVSSTHIRQYIQEGKVSRACRMLGQWFEVEGPIVSGAGRGRNLTVPTINLEPANELLPRPGVYITRIAVDSGGYADSVTNIGMRPTFGGDSLTVETFVLKGSVPEHPAAARVQFLWRLRDERRFDSPELLREQIGRDVRSASKFFRMLQAGGHAKIHSH